MGDDFRPFMALCYNFFMEVSLSDINQAIQRLRESIRWRPGSLERHLAKRKARGHLPADATTQDYEAVIIAALSHATAFLYLYWHSGTAYVAIRTEIENQVWLVMFDLQGWMESAFVVEKPQSYFSKLTFQAIGHLKDIEP